MLLPVWWPWEYTQDPVWDVICARDTVTYVGAICGVQCVVISGNLLWWELYVVFNVWSLVEAYCVFPPANHPVRMSECTHPVTGSHSLHIYLDNIWYWPITISLKMYINPIHSLARDVGIFHTYNSFLHGGWYAFCMVFHVRWIFLTTSLRILPESLAIERHWSPSHLEETFSGIRCTSRHVSNMLNSKYTVQSWRSWKWLCHVRWVYL